MAKASYGEGSIPKSFLPTNVIRFTIPERKPGYPWMELYSAMVAAMTFLCTGIVQAYTSGAIHSIQNDHESNVSVTHRDISYFASAPPLAALLGTVVTGPIMESMGRRKTITLLSFPLILGWLIIGNAVNMNMILIGRFCTGISLGSSRSAAPVYVSETVRAKHRGKLGYLPPIMAAIGVLVGCTLGSVIHWKQLALLMTSFPVILFFASLPLPESPHWLIKRNQEDQAFVNLKRLRGGQQDYTIYKEINEIREAFELQESSSDIPSSSGVMRLYHLFKQPNIRFPAMLVFVLMIFQQFSGVSAVIYFLKMILNHGSAPNQSGTPAHDIRPAIVGGVHIVAFFVSLPLVDRMGRKFLLKISGILMALSHCALVFYFYHFPHSLPTTNGGMGSTTLDGNVSSNTGNDGSSADDGPGSSFAAIMSSTESWLPLVSLCAYIASFSLASPVPFILMSEIFGSNVRSYLCSVATLICSLASLIVVHMFPILMYDVTPTFTFALFAFLSLQTTFIAFIIPETKGKSLAEIENLFRTPRDFRGKTKDIVDIPCLQIGMVSKPC